MKKKIIIIALYYYYPYVSGLSIHAKRIAEGLVKRGIDVTILTINFDKKQKAHEVINGVKIIRKPFLFSIGKGVVSINYWLDVIKHSKNSDYVNLMLPMAESGLISLFVKKEKLIISYVCDLNLGKGLISRLISAVSFISMRIALIRTNIIFPLSIDYLSSSKMKEFTNKAEGVNPIINNDDFKPCEYGKLFKRLGIRNNEVKIGFVGRIVYEKGIGFLLDSIQYLEKDLPNLRIIIVGDYKNIVGGSIKDRLDQYIDKYPNKIVFTGFLPEEELDSFYSGLDVFVLPSIDPLEAFGIVQVESMLCGTPVVASALPGVREVIQKTGFGLLAKPKDSRDLAEKILKVVNNQAKYQPKRSVLLKEFNENISLKPYLKRLK